MNTRLTILLLLLLSTHLHAQPPKLSIIGGAGAWRDWLPYEDANHNTFQRWQQQSGFGISLENPISSALLFSTAVGLKYYPMHHEYSYSGESRIVTSNLAMFFARLSPGVGIMPLKAVSIRVGVTGLISAFTAGDYLWTRSNTPLGRRDSILYTDHFEQIRNPFIWGPEMAIGYRFPESKSGQFGMRISSFLGMNGVFRKDFFTPFNPRIFQSRLELTYTFPTKEKPYKERESR
jgi:hypothetical protein